MRPFAVVPKTKGNLDRQQSKSNPTAIADLSFRMLDIARPYQSPIDPAISLILLKFQAQLRVRADVHCTLHLKRDAKAGGDCDMPWPYIKRMKTRMGFMAKAMCHICGSRLHSSGKCKTFEHVSNMPHLPCIAFMDVLGAAL